MFSAIYPGVGNMFIGNRMVPVMHKEKKELELCLSLDSDTAMELDLQTTLLDPPI